MSNSKVKNKPKKPFVLGLGGSLRENSATNHALRIVVDGATRAGAETEMQLLIEKQLPSFRGSYDIDGYSQNEVEKILKLHADVDKASGIILASPTYSNVISGAVKNLLDLLEVNNEDGPYRFGGKVIGLLTVQGGTSGTGFNTLTTMLLASRALGGWVSPKMVSIPASRSVFNPDGKAKDSSIEKRLLSLGEEIARNSKMFALHWKQ